MRVKNESEKIEKSGKDEKKNICSGVGGSKGGSLFKIDTIDSSVKVCRPVKST